MSHHTWPACVQILGKAPKQPLPNGGERGDPGWGLAWWKGSNISEGCSGAHENRTMAPDVAAAA